MKHYTSIVLAFIALFCACRRTDHIELSSKNEVAIATSEDMKTINPFLGSSDIHQEVWQKLNQLHPKTNELIPVLASLPRLSEDRLTYTYTLDPNARWSDGKPVNPEDVIFTIKTVANPFSHCDAWKSYFTDLDSVWSDSAQAVKFHYRRWKFNREYDIGDIYILPKHTFDSLGLSYQYSWDDLHSKNPNESVKRAGEEFANTENSRFLNHFIGSGPYVFEDWDYGYKVILRKNPKYWAMNIPWLEAYPDKLTYITISDWNAKLVALKKQEVDITEIRTKSWLALDSSWSFIKKDTIYTSCFYNLIKWNNRNTLFASKKVRKALTMLIDRDALVRVIQSGFARKAEAPLVYPQPGWNPDVRQPEYDPFGAKKLLQEEGWTEDGDGILHKIIKGKHVKFEFSLLGGNRFEPYCMIPSESFRKAGIIMNIKEFDHSMVLEALRKKNYDACFIGYSNDPVEIDLYDDYHSSGENNELGYSDVRADSLMETIRAEPDRGKRLAMQQRLQAIITDDQPATFLLQVPAKFAWIDRFDNMQFQPTDPGFDPRFFIVRGSGVKPIAHLQ